MITSAMGPELSLVPPPSVAVALPPVMAGLLVVAGEAVPVTVGVVLMLVVAGGVVVGGVVSAGCVPGI